MTGPVQDEAVARTRFFIIGLTRLAGAFALMVGILAVMERIPVPVIAGYLLLIAGAANTLIIPRILARKWRSDAP